MPSDIAKVHAFENNARFGCVCVCVRFFMIPQLNIIACFHLRYLGLVESSVT